MSLKEILEEYFPEQDVEKVLKAIEVDGSEEKYDPRKIAQHMGRKLLNSEEFLPVTKDIFNSIFSLADFADDEESLFVADVFYRNMGKKDILPRMIDYFNDLYIDKNHEAFGSKELAEKCLVSTSLHYNQLYERCRRRNAPHPDFYISLGSMLFGNIGQEKVSENFENWRLYVRDTFVF